MTDRARRTKATTGLTAAAFSAFLLLAPAASAQVSTSQVPGVDVPDVQAPSTGGGGSDAGGTVGGTVGTVTDTVTDTTGGTTDSGGSVGGTVGGVVEQTSGTVKDTGGTTIVDQTKKTIENTTTDAGNTVNSTVGGAQETAAGLGGTVTNPILTVKDADGDGKISKKERVAAARRTETRTGSGSGSKVRQALLAERRQERAAAAARKARLSSLDTPTRKTVQGIELASAPQRESLMTQIAEAAVQATKALAFPLGLALMVGAFLMVQGRIDRKDAKLALAPIDSEQDLLSFQ